MQKASIRKKVRSLASYAAKFNFGKSEITPIALELYAGLDTPVSLGCYLRLKYGEWQQLVDMDARPDSYLTVDAFWDDYCAVSFLRKCQYNIGLDTKSKADDSFILGELRCASTNERLDLYLSGLLNPKDLRCAAILQSATAIIAEILGPFSAQEWEDSCRFGPGTVVGTTHNNTTPYHKLIKKPTVTPRFFALGSRLANAFRGWRLAHGYDLLDEGNVIPELVAGGRYAVVPKTAKTDRPIEVQPNLNAFAQMGLGRMIRSRLRRFGLNLNTQERNQQSARLASLGDKLATIDLSGASDSIAYNLVREVIPHDWFFALDLCRTERIQKDGNWQELHRFSSMGNGYTFELESLIFFAISLSCERFLNTLYCPRVFGDDIICTVRSFPLLRDTLSFLGFDLNLEKSFWSGPFKESCGHDYWDGTNVRPYFWKGHEESSLTELISLANGIRRLSLRRNYHFGCDVRFRAAWLRCLRWVPKPHRSDLLGPWSNSDQWFIGDSSDELRGSGSSFCRNTLTWKQIGLSLSRKSYVPDNAFGAISHLLYKMYLQSSGDITDEHLDVCERTARMFSRFGLPGHLVSKGEVLFVPPSSEHFTHWVRQ